MTGKRGKFQDNVVLWTVKSCALGLFICWAKEKRITVPRTIADKISKSEEIMKVYLQELHFQI